MISTRLVVAIFLNVWLVSCHKSFAAVNSYMLHTYPANDQAEILGNLKNAGFKVIRIMIAQVSSHEKKSSNVGVKDLETDAVGNYDSTILTKIDELMFQAHSRGLKLNIVLHDRYSLGCWQNDAYMKKYKINKASACPVGNDVRGFYQNAEAAKDIDKRYQFIVNHKNSHFNNKRWGDISEAIFGFDMENESQAYNAGAKGYGYKTVNKQWTCDRAKNLRPHVDKNILLITGGGAFFGDSLLVENFKCPALDVITLHSYSNDFGQNLPKAKQLAKEYKKRVFVQEFGATKDKANSLGHQIDAINQNGVPWMFWQFLKPNNPSDFETYTTDEKTWSVLKEKAQYTLKSVNAVDDWPEAFTLTPAGKKATEKARDDSVYIEKDHDDSFYPENSYGDSIYIEKADDDSDYPGRFFEKSIYPNIAHGDRIYPGNVYDGSIYLEKAHRDRIYPGNVYDGSIYLEKAHLDRIYPGKAYDDSIYIEEAHDESIYIK